MVIYLLILQAKGGGLAFIQGNQTSFQKNIFNGKPSQELVVYVVFDPHSSKTHELSVTGQQNLATVEETGGTSFNLLL